MAVMTYLHPEDYHMWLCAYCIVSGALFSAPLSHLGRAQGSERNLLESSLGANCGSVNLSWTDVKMW